MSNIQEPNIFLAHCDGHTVVSFSSDGKYIITGGSDNLVRRFNASIDGRDEEPQTMQYHSQPINSIMATKEQIIIGSENCSVTSHCITSLNFLETLSRCTLPIRSFDVLLSRKSGKPERVAIISEELNIKLYDCVDKKVHYLSGLKQPANAVAFHPNGRILVAISSNGTLHKYDLSNHVNRDESNFEPIVSFKDISYSTLPRDKNQFQISYHPKGTYLAVPGKEKGVRLLKGDSLVLYKDIATNQNNKISLCEFSPNGKFVASVGLDNYVTIYNLESETPENIFSYQNDTKVTGLDWSPKDNTLCITDDNGVLKVFDSVINAAHLNNTNWTIEDDTKNNMIDIFDNDIPDDKAISIDDINDEYTQQRKLDSIDMGFHIKSSSRGSEIGEGLEEDLQSISDRSFKNAHYTNEKVQLQKAFLPGSTSIEGSECQFLNFNSIGYVSAYATHEKTMYNVVFHDQSKLKNYKFSDYGNYTMASIGSRGTLFGSQIDEENDKDAVIYYRLHGNWSTNEREWRMILDKDEDIITLCATSYGPVVVTTLGYIRYFSHSGNQIDIAISYSPTMLTICTDHRDLLLFVYHQSADANDARLGYTIYNIETKQKCNEGQITLGRGASLEWAGFSDKGTPAYSDSYGTVSVLLNLNNNNSICWKPVLRLDVNTQFPFGLDDENLHYLLITPGSSWIIEPEPSMTPFKIPLISNTNTEIKLEEELLNTKIKKQLYIDSLIYEDHKLAEMNSREIDKFQHSEDKIILTLIGRACKNKQVKMAIELVLMLNEEYSLTLAKNIAARYDALELVRSIPELAKKKALQKKLNDDQSQDDIVNALEYETTKKSRDESTKYIDISNKNKAQSPSIVNSKRQVAEESPFSKSYGLNQITPRLNPRKPIILNEVDKKRSLGEVNDETTTFESNNKRVNVIQALFSKKDTNEKKDEENIPGSIVLMSDD
ncbi:WD40 repeat-like protein [Neoconidiobolus thromboides FSU 785]|nr:WD40 repeat-like protein [Neoconidiobolus thromboides FSU 785]